MDYLFQKVSYLQGLADGLNFDESTNEGLLLLHIVDLLADFAEVLEEVVEDQIDLEDYVDFIDEDLTDLEEEIYDLDDFDFLEDLDESEFDFSEEE